MALDDYANRGRHLSDDDTTVDEPLELDEEIYDEGEDTGEFVDDEDEGGEEEKTSEDKESGEDLPPTMRIAEGDSLEEPL